MAEREESGSLRKTDDGTNKEISGSSKKPDKQDEDDEYENSSEHFESVVKNFEELKNGKTDGWLFQSLILLARGFEVDHQEKKLLAPDLTEKHFRDMFEKYPEYMRLTLEMSTKLPSASGVLGQPTDTETLAEVGASH